MESRKNVRNRFGWALVSLLLTGGVGGVEAADPANGPGFLRDVRPIFKAHCFRCHGAANFEGEFRLDRKRLAMKGGETGAAIVPGKAAASLLLKIFLWWDWRAFLLVPLVTPLLSRHSFQMLGLICSLFLLLLG